MSVSALTLSALLSITPPVVAQAKSNLPSVADARKLGDVFADIADKVSSSVVQLDVAVAATNSPLLWFRAEGVQRGLGSGVIFSNDGAILTNNHVIEEARSITVRLRDGRTFPAKLVGRDPATDLAVVRIEAKGLPTATLADSDRARVGEWVLAVGSPFGLGYTITTGVLSAKNRGGVGVNAVEDYLQTDASINPGNSGGPLVNLDGQVLGINTMIVSRAQGIGLAVPSRIAQRVAEQILKRGYVDRAWMGVGLQDLTPQLAREIKVTMPGGALINSIAADGPAAKAHLETGDILASVAGKTVRDAQDVIREMLSHDAGETISLEVLRKGKRYQTQVRLESRNEPRPPPLPIERRSGTQAGLGLATRDETEASDQKGSKLVFSRVTSVLADSPADRAGLKAGDIVLAADEIKRPTSSELRAATADGHALLLVRRNSSNFYTVITSLTY